MNPFFKIVLMIFFSLSSYLSYHEIYIDTSNLLLQTKKNILIYKNVRISFFIIKSIYKGYTFKTTYKNYLHLFHSSLLWLKPRPISNSQLHALPHFHLCPIYLVVFKGSYYLSVWEILSLGGLHA